MKNKPLLTSLTFALVLALSFGTVIATTLFRPVRAGVNPTYTYSVDNKIVMHAQPALIYNGSIYAPITELASALGYTASVGEDRATLTKQTTSTASTVTISRAMIAKIDFSTNLLTVYPEGQPNNLIDLVVTPSTSISYAANGQRATLVDLGNATVVKVVRSPQTTKGTIPQATAISIQILPTNAPQPR